MQRSSVGTIHFSCFCRNGFLIGSEHRYRHSLRPRDSISQGACVSCHRRRLRVVVNRGWRIGWCHRLSLFLSFFFLLFSLFLLLLQKFEFVFLLFDLTSPWLFQSTKGSNHQLPFVGVGIVQAAGGNHDSRNVCEADAPSPEIGGEGWYPRRFRGGNRQPRNAARRILRRGTTPSAISDQRSLTDNR